MQDCPRNGHITREQLREMQAWPLEKKVQVTTCRIEEWYDLWGGQVYVAFSGGKDSTVLLDIVRGIYPDVPAVFSDTGLEYPEIREFVKTFDNVEIVRPQMSFKRVIETYGYPVVSKEQARYIRELRHSKSEKLRRIRTDGNRWGMGKVSKKWTHLVNAPFEIGEQCCNELKKKPNAIYEKQTGRKPYLGEMADESIKRTQDYMRFGCNAFGTNRPISRPIAFWTEQDIFRYISRNGLKIASVYGQIQSQGRDNGYTCTGVKRTGCVFCAFGAHLEKEPNRFQRLQKTHPQLWNYCIDNLGMGEVLDYIGVPYVWRPVPEQITLFDWLKEQQDNEGESD
jgi:3'-phosphoadenosine 5'-phosphosulfate sulfotransferase (PAPS reductase)/FAD synthetase